MPSRKLIGIFLTICLVLPVVMLTSCRIGTPSNLSEEDIIPMPVSVIATGDYFTISDKTAIYFSGESDDVNQVAEYLAGRLRPATGFEIPVNAAKGAPGRGNFYLTLADSVEGDEGYVLVITKKLVTLAAKKPAGLFRGVQTIRQLLPAGIELGADQEIAWKLATGTITDYPAYEYRGAMLDVARHFFGVEDVKRVIDLIAAYKMNTLHLHLSDDQGWRIEIKSWPDLTIHGGSTQVGGGKGGFFTQEQYSDIVKYADQRYITIVPEIDMPGHTNAALSSYAELNCNGKETELYTGTEVGFSTLCTGKEITYKFIDDVVKELSELTTGPYIHIGGDESHVTKKEDYIPFVEKVQDIVLSHNKKALGWDEISLGVLRPGTVAQFWSNAENAKRAVSQGAKLLMSPAARTYIDMKYDSTTVLGLKWAGYVEVDASYNWDPATLVAGIGKENITGIEAPLWTETITNMEEMEFMIFPRLPALAEVGWTPASLRNWDDFKLRLGEQGPRFKAMDINFYPSKLIPWAE
jgi:hexosaminidase